MKQVDISVGHTAKLRCSTTVSPKGLDTADDKGKRESSSIFSVTKSKNEKAKAKGILTP